MNKLHTFHIPVMGTAFTIDSPAKIAPFGLSSVISLVDDLLIEEMREFYCKQNNEEYVMITKYEEDYRAKRITAYLNLLDRIVQNKFNTIKASSFGVGGDIDKYFELLPETSPVKQLYLEMLLTEDVIVKQKIQDELRSYMDVGDINVNIMTKLDRINLDLKGNELPQEYSDALSALRGYAQSTLTSSIVFSAGINQRLYGYAEKFKDFFADANGFIKKKIILKVSDYRSALIQGKYFAKKGLWVSEYRIESGLNCGGHVFPTEGYLMGPILQEFKDKRSELISFLHKTYNEALSSKNLKTFNDPHEIKITAQGGIGTADENSFLLNYYELHSTGWGTPFLLVPEVTNVDDVTLKKLSAATEADLYVSNISPLGVSFNNLRGNLSDEEKERKAITGKPGSACPKGHLVSNTEFTEKPICTASRQYQKLKVEQLEKLNLSLKAFKTQYDQIIQKACICHNLGEAVLIKNNIIKNSVKKFTAICPGPNLAYFSKVVSLKEMADHIYGRINILNKTYRPHMFVKELKMYIDHFIKEVEKCSFEPTDKQIKYFNEFIKNLTEGMDYYKELYPKMINDFHCCQKKAIDDLNELRQNFYDFVTQHAEVFSVKLPKISIT